MLNNGRSGGYNAARQIGTGGIPPIIQPEAMGGKDYGLFIVCTAQHAGAVL
jgi:hypothetical protein